MKNFVLTFIFSLYIVGLSFVSVDQILYFRMSAPEEVTPKNGAFAAEAILNKAEFPQRYL